MLGVLTRNISVFPDNRYILQANYSVQFDNFIIFYSANQSETEYQQLLFGQTFNTSGTHFVSLTSHHLSSTDNWLDLDYITITVNETDR